MTSDGETSGGTRVFETSVTGLRRVPYRVALGILSGGPLLWLAFFVVTPLVLLIAALAVDERFAPYAIGLSLLFGLTFWWSGYRYASPRVTVDPKRGTIRIQHDATPAWTTDKTVDVADLEGVSLVPLGGFVLVRLAFTTPNVFRPWDFVIERSDRSALEAALQRTGVAVHEPGDRWYSRWHTAKVPVRLATTLVVLLGVPIVTLLAFGRRALQGNLVFIAGLVVVWTLQAQITRAAGIRPERFSLGILLDVVGTFTVLVTLYWLSLHLLS